jgi:hypothetical protein
MQSFRVFKCHVIWDILLLLGKSCTATLGVMASTLGNAVVEIYNATLKMSHGWQNRGETDCLSVKLHT